MENLREIHIGNIISEYIEKEDIKANDVIKKMKISKHKLTSTLASKSIDSDELLKWSKFFNIDLFRLYSGHLILHHGISGIKPKKSIKTEKLIIRKNVYTIEIKKFIIDQVKNKELTVSDAISKYNIPKTTIYKWIRQY
jgi:hypothetical protein